VAGAFTLSRGPVMRWGQWTTANLERVLSRSPEPIWNTMTYAAAATAIAILLSAIIGYLVVRRAIPSRR
jgi:iron(III) transport system permease protein